MPAPILLTYYIIRTSGSSLGEHDAVIMDDLQDSASHWFEASYCYKLKETIYDCRQTKKRAKQKQRSTGSSRRVSMADL